MTIRQGGMNYYIHGVLGAVKSSAIPSNLTFLMKYLCSKTTPIRQPARYDLCNSTMAENRKRDPESEPETPLARPTTRPRLMDAVGITSELDANIFKRCKLAPDDLFAATRFLATIAQFSDSSQIDPKYKNIAEAESFLSQHAALVEDLKRAFQAKSCESIRANGAFSMSWIATIKSKFCM